MTDRSESAILKAALCDVSREPGVMAWRNNTGMAWQGQRMLTRPGQSLTIRKGMVVLVDARPITFGLAGSADILGVHEGRAFALEAKTRVGRQSEQQQKFQAAFERAGGLYGLFRSEDEALRILRGG
ncbi:hypothetical protein [Sphingomonas baiyangensis]|uniref:VRR-NUC domain-containing protein n=1 Tax=Sphingomonas baiyangensis TaxID=2572576 RepID=A0A4V5PTM0_9SPHN|nr:hypothetical protein [Sphingomonas baiyangensis]TKD50558.1 hypothetical protein FBR43_07115 [Sphingomonas baiyangensis]